MRPIKFRFWCPAANCFVKNYNYSGAVDELFEEDEQLVPQQFTGITDSEGTDIYEGDYVSTDYNPVLVHEVKYSPEETAYVLDTNFNYAETYFGDCVYLSDFKNLIVTGNVFEGRKII